MATILAVDDEQPILELIKSGLQKDGHMVTGYVSAEQVPLNHLNRYDLIILDIMMPGVLPVKRTMKNNKFFSVSLLTGWRYFYAAFNVSS